jgi:hypothetical protein
MQHVIDLCLDVYDAFGNLDAIVGAHLLDRLSIEAHVDPEIAVGIKDLNLVVAFAGVQRGAETTYMKPPGAVTRLISRKASSGLDVLHRREAEDNVERPIIEFHRLRGYLGVPRGRAWVLDSDFVHGVDTPHFARLCVDENAHLAPTVASNHEDPLSSRVREFLSYQARMVRDVIERSVRGPKHSVPEVCDSWPVLFHRRRAPVRRGLMALMLLV